MWTKQTRDKQEFWRQTALGVNPGTTIQLILILGNLLTGLSKPPFSCL